MKKLLAVVVLASLSLTVSAQTYTHNSKVRVKTTNTAASTDNIVSIDANGELKRTTQTVSDLGGTPENLQTTLDAGNTSTTGINLSNANLVSSFGLSNATVSPTDVSVNGRFGGMHILESSVARWGANPATQRTVLSFSNPSTNEVVTVRNITGTVALTSELLDFVDKTSSESIGGTKNFTDFSTIVGSLILENRSNISSALGGNLSYKTNAFQFTPRNGDNGEVFSFKFDGLTSSRIYTMPDKDIEVAGLSDTSVEWALTTGTRAGGDLIVSQGDFDNSGNGTKIVISDDDEELMITANSGVKINNNTLSVTAEGAAAYFRNVSLATTPTSAALNVSHPLSANPVNTSLYNTILDEVYLRVTATSWKMVGTTNL